MHDAHPERQLLVDSHFRSHTAYWGDVYDDDDDIAGAVYRRRRGRVLSWIEDLELAPASRVLDVGCGTGPIAIPLAERGYRVDAVDSVGEMVDATRRNAAAVGVSETLRVSVADAARLPFEDGTFDLVVALGVLPWVPAPDNVVVDAARVVAPRGYVLLSADNRASLQAFIDPLSNPVLLPAKRVAKWMLYRARLRRPRPSLNPPLSFATLERMLVAAGLELIRHTTLGFMPLTVFRHAILPRGSARTLDGWLHHQVDRNRPLVRVAGAQHLVLARSRGAAAGR